MRIGIVTLYHENFNYGGLLQAFALQQSISRLGVECEVLQFNSLKLSYYLKRLAHFTPAQAVNAIKRVLREKLASSGEKNRMEARKNAFRQFEAMIPHSSLISAKSYKEALGGYDVLIVGSDQVWNPAWWNDILLLKGIDGSSVRKTSYAASMGCSSLSAQDAATLNEALRDYTFLSVREPSAASLLRELSPNCEAVVSLDPTLLFDEPEWVSALPKKDEYRVPNEPYALLYLVDKFKRYTDKSIDVCLKAGLQCVVVSYSSEMRTAARLGVIRMNDCTPQEWVHLVHEADVVITDSFHGVAFSSSFKKPFWCYRKTETLNGSNLDDRQSALLSRLGLQDRIIESDTDITEQMLKSVPCFDMCEKELRRERGASLEHLKSCLGID